MKRVLGIILSAAALLPPCPAPACTICSGNPQTASSLRQGAAQAKLILYGTMTNAQLNAGTTDMQIETTLRSDPFLGDKKTITVPRYVPANGKNLPKYIVFCDVFNNKLDVYQGVEVKTPALVDYLKGALALDAKDRSAALLYFFRYLDHADETVANDAFLEFAKANDAEVGQVAKKLSPDRLKKLMADPKTPAGRIGLFAFLLGACGTTDDADVLRRMLDKPDERTAGALDGALAGYIQLRSKEGWQLAHSILQDEKRPFADRCAVLNMLRFTHGWKGKEAEAEILKGVGTLLQQGDIADMAIEDLRKWKQYELTASVLALYGKKSHDAPLMRRAIVRYALCCPRDEAKRFVDERRKQDGELVKDVEESLSFEKAK